MRVTGNVTSWNEDKGFGFAEATVGGRQIFIQVSDVKSELKRFRVGQKVTYIQVTDQQGRACASEVCLHGERLKQKSRKKGYWVLFVVVSVSVCVAFSFWGSADIPSWGF